MRAVAKRGRANFKKDVLFIFNTSAEAFAKEFELVEAAKADLFCYNLRQGGNGGFDWINAQPEITKRRSVKNIKKLHSRIKTDSTLRNKWKTAVATSVAEANRRRVWTPEQKHAAQIRLAAGKQAIPKAEFCRRLSKSIEGRVLSAAHKGKISVSRRATPK
jgi:hypothetical protein